MNAQVPAGEQHRILILLNGSKEMLGKWSESENKYQVSTRLLSSLVDSLYMINEDVEFGLRVYGHQHTVGEQDCYDSKREVMFSKDTRTQMALRLADIKPKGIAAMNFALKEANELDIVATEDYKYSLIIVTDGSMQCTDDICNTMFELKKKMKFRPYVLLVGDNESFMPAHGCIGEFLPVKTENNIRYAIGNIVKEYRKILPPRPPETEPVKRQRPPEADWGTTPKPKAKPVQPAVKKEETFVLDTLKTGRVAEAEPGAVVVSKNSRIKATDGRPGGVRFMNIARINHIAVINTDDAEGAAVDVFPVGLDEYKLELKPGKYKINYFLYGLAFSMDFAVHPGEVTDVWLAR